MRTPTAWLVVFVLLMGCMCVGCARTARDTTGFAITDTATVNAPVKDAWQIAKAVLREKDYDLYTRDKRGVFVAFSGSKRDYLLGYHRVKYTVSLESASDSSTLVTVESVRQVYGVTLLTYPGWHDRKTQDHSGAQAILKAIEAKVAGGPTAAVSETTASS